VASQQSSVDFICEQMGAAGTISSRKMFGEYGVYCDGKFIGVIFQDRLFLKITKAGERLAVGLERAPPYRGAKPSFMIYDERIEDRDWLAALVSATHDDPAEEVTPRIQDRPLPQSAMPPCHCARFKHSPALALF
jgi:TfoX/Sxy family transcriptional regulator of competence genes